MTKFINNTKTAVLLAALFGLILWVGSFWGMHGLIIAFIFGGIGNIFAYFFSDKIALATMGGHEVDADSAPDLIEMVSRLARNADLPMPRVYICPQQAPNAFATGRNPKHAAVAVTQGALRLLDYDELEGVIGHELSHVKNHDTLISAVAATIAGALQMLGWVALFGGFGGGGNNRDGGNALVGLIMLILAPLAAGLIQMAISRSREFVADADGAKLAGSPWGLIHALQKLETTNQRIPMQHEMPSQNHMFIVQPLSGGGGGMMSGLAKLFATHPPTEERIARLRELA